MSDAKLKLSTHFRMESGKKVLTENKCLPVIIIGVKVVANDAVCECFSLDAALNKNDLLELIEAAKQIVIRQ